MKIVGFESNVGARLGVVEGDLCVPRTSSRVVQKLERLEEPVVHWAQAYPSAGLGITVGKRFQRSPDRSVRSQGSG